MIYQSSDINKLVTIIKSLNEGLYEYKLKPERSEDDEIEIPQFLAEEGKPQCNVETQEEKDDIKLKYSLKLIRKLE